MHTDSSCPSIPEPEPIIKRFRRGDVREDGRIFWVCSKREGERWLTSEQFHRRKAAVSLYGRELLKSPEKREKIYQRNRTWQKANVQRATRRANARRKERRLTEPVFALASRCRVNLHRALKVRSLNKNSKSAKILGCSWDEFGTHIESQFSPGMTWGNIGEWHLDHIVPLALAKTERDVNDLNHHTNMRPLWRLDNITKAGHPPTSGAVSAAPPEIPPHPTRVTYGGNSVIQEWPRHVLPPTAFKQAKFGQITEAFVMR